ncbi:MAG: hypothetical protein GX850_01930 [Clostridiaceae bacterium]|nr:hypothetical protein [Clostridiaceae bacterium]
MRIIIEALKIDKIPKSRRVHIWFLLLFGVATVAYVTMPTGGQLDVFQNRIQSFLQNEGVFPFPPTAWFSYLFRQVGLTVVSLWFILLYAVHWLFAFPGMPDDEDSTVFKANGVDIPDDAGLTPFKTTLRAFPATLILAIAMIAPYIISIPALGIPFYVIASMLSMTVFIMIFEDKNIPSAMETSYKMTMGMKLFIFVSFMFLRAATSIMSDLLRLIFADSVWAGSLIRAFFFALKTLAFGRLAAIFYRSFSVRDLVVQSRTLDGF